MTIVRAKLMAPRRQADIVERERLIARLNDLWSKSLGLVVAPAGFGKTTLALSWMSRRPERVAWLTVDTSDNDVERFLGYVLLAIGSVAPGSIENTRALAERSSRPTSRDLAETLADELIDSDGDVCLVLDEAEHLISPEAWEFLECLIRLAPPRFHLLVLSRIDPPLPLARFRMREQIVEVRGSELLLTSDQIRQLFADQDVELPERAILDIERATHGWPAGVRLALMQPRTSVEPNSSRDSTPAVPSGFMLDPLADEVVDQLPADASEALFIASIMTDLTPDLLQAILGPDRSTTGFIEDFTRAGVLMRSTERGGAWVRMHPLFQDVFRRQLASRRPRALIRQWHRDAAQWFLNEGDVHGAIRHLSSAGDIDAVVDILGDEIPRAFDREDWGSVSDWLDLLSDDIIARAPVLALGRLWVLFFKASWLAMGGAQADARRLIGNLPAEMPQRSQWLAELDILGAHESGPLGGDAASRLAIVERAAPHIDPRRRFVMGHIAYLRATTLEDLGKSQDADAAIAAAIGQSGTRVDSAMIRPLVARCFVLRQRGALPLLGTAASELVTLAERHELPVARGWGKLFHAFVLFQRNHLSAAEPILADLVADHRRIHVACLHESMLLLARTYWAQGHPTESAAVVRRLRELLTARGSIELLQLVPPFEMFLRYLGSPSSVVDDLPPVESDAVLKVTPQLMHHPVTSAILVNSESGGARAEHALFLATAFGARLTTIHFACWQPEILALRAIALSALDREVEARAAMRLALAPGVARHLTRTLLDLGPRAHDLYRYLTTDPGVGTIAQALVDVIDASGQAHGDTQTGEPLPARGAPTRQAGLLSLLTDRELGVLELLEQRLSYKEIGSTLFISPLTVKRHAGNIYDKLGVNCRRDAISVAHDLGWSTQSDPT